MKCTLALLALTAAGGMLIAKDHVRLNLTPSMPLGLWWITPGAVPVTGNVVVACLPGDAGLNARLRGYLTSGPCPGDRSPLLKPVVALQGDVVLLTPERVTVNGIALSDSAQIKTDSAGREMFHMNAGTYVVGRDSAWLIATGNPRSFDSRYFGQLHLSFVQGVATPLLTWEN